MLWCRNPITAPFLVTGQAAGVIARAKEPDTSIASGDHIGIVGRLSPVVGESLGLPAGVPAFVAELALEPLAAFQRTTLKAAAPPRFPSVDRDISILVDETTAARSVRETVRDSRIPILVDLREFDRYAGKGVPAGKVSLSLRLTFRSLDRTLTDTEVQSAMDDVLKALKDRHGAVQR